MKWALVLTVCGCSGSGATGKLQLSWEFADGRLCSDSGAASIWVKAGDAGKSFACDEGMLPAEVSLDGVPADGVAIVVQALSTDGAALYSGTLNLDALPSAATVTLYADKMR